MQKKSFTFEVSVSRIELCTWEALSYINQKKKKKKDHSSATILAWQFSRREDFTVFNRFDARKKNKNNKIQLCIKVCNIK